MNPNDPNLQQVELVVRALGELCDELVLVGGCATGLLCTSMQAPPPHPCMCSAGRLRRRRAAATDFCRQRSRVRLRGARAIVCPAAS